MSRAQVRRCAVILLLPFLGFEDAAAQRPVTFKTRPGELEKKAVALP